MHALVLALCCCTVGQIQFGAACAVAADRSKLPGRSDPDWDAAFTRSDGWTGGDVIGTVDLQDGRTVWMFGDTWIGRIVDGKHAPGSRLVNNSIAVHRSRPEHRDDPPTADEVKFHWAPDDADGHPTAWVVPKATSGARETGDRQTEQPPSWYWTTGGGVFLPGEATASRLVLFLFHVGRRSEQESVWNFENIGSAMAVVENPGEPADDWRVRQLPIPHAVSAEQARQDTRQKQTSWGMAAFAHPANDETGRQFVYIYGVREALPINKRAVLARVPPAEIEQFDRWEFYAGQDRWSPDPADVDTVCDRVVSEFSVEAYTLQGQVRFVMVHSEPVFGTRIFVRTAPRPEGPWSKPLPVFKVPDVQRDPSFFTYAAKGHAHLSPPGELLISYVVNAHDFKAMVNDAFIYRPRFVRVPLQAVFSGD